MRALPRNAGVGSPGGAAGTASDVPQGLGHLDTLHRAGGGALNAHTQLLARGPGAGSQPGGKNREKHQNRHNPRGWAGDGHLWRWHSLAAMAGGQQGNPSLLCLTWQIPLIVHQGFATCGCSSFDPDLRILGTRLISTPAQG